MLDAERAERDPANDPLPATIGISLVFLAFAVWRLAVFDAPIFDEIHYLPAAHGLLSGERYLNPEHPPLGKEIIALGIALLGDNPWGWRLLPAIAGAVTLFAAMRALWHASHRAPATLAYGVLLATGFVLFVQSRIAMLDIFMGAFIMVALWMFAASFRARSIVGARIDLALAGAALGCALASKWNAIPLAPVPGLIFLVVRWWAVGTVRLPTARGAPPVRGIGLPEAALWLGVLPLAVYAITFWPAFAIERSPLAGRGIIGAQEYMLALQMSVKGFHPYQTHWIEWVLNTRGIWYAYDTYGGALRGVLMIGNPLTMWLGLVALVWATYAALVERRADAGAVVILYAASIVFWIVAAKPVQFYYHYFLPSCFQLAALALALDRLRTLRWGWAMWAVLAASAVLFAYFYPILAGMPLPDERAFMQWVWLERWV